ncbi:MAG: isoleucine-tRNA ligase [Chaenotheca gracillima]|nr:MAG: isoleucine-tRNA ligase [Chaenotheca gracillima]
MAANILSFEVFPNQGLGVLLLGTSLHDVLTYLKSRPRAYPKISISFSSSNPIKCPVVLELPPNGLRLRFDGIDQRLRLIEVLEFAKSRLIYKSTEIVRAVAEPSTVTAATSPSSAGPTFRHVYHRLFGPSFPGDYVPPEADVSDTKGTYVLSYPGIAFSFPLQHASWSPDADFVSLLSSSAAAPARSMAIFSGSSWPEARQELFTRTPVNPRSVGANSRAKEATPDEVDLVKVHGAGRVELVRRTGPSFWIQLSETTPQDLVAELGPPDAIYRKQDRRLSIHRPSTSRETAAHGLAGLALDDAGELTDNDRSPAHTNMEESDEDSGSPPDFDGSPPTSECFYNYFHHGFDILISRPTQLSPVPPPLSGKAAAKEVQAPQAMQVSQELTATKILLHGNIPGSYPFNRHRRIRWILEYDVSGMFSLADSEVGFAESSKRLKAAWEDMYTNGEEAASLQKGMVLNRGWGDSPSSSCELLGGWEEGLGGRKKGTMLSSVDGEQGLGNTELFGFPGLVFEVLKNDAVTCLTVF